MAQVFSGEMDDFIAPDYTSGQYVIHYESPAVKKIPKALIVVLGVVGIVNFVFKSIQYILR
jgi:hypothetical protein